MKNPSLVAGPRNVACALRSGPPFSSFWDQFGLVLGRPPRHFSSLVRDLYSLGSGELWRCLLDMSPPCSFISIVVACLLCIFPELPLSVPVFSPNLHLCVDTWHSYDASRLHITEAGPQSDSFRWRAGRERSEKEESVRGDGSGARRVLGPFLH